MLALVLIERPGHVCWRYRIEAFVPALAQRGARVEALPIARSTLRRLPQLAGAGRADVVILQRRLLPLWQLAVLRRAARRLVYDFDDALFCRDSFQRKLQESWQRLARFWATVFAADLVIAGNSYLWCRASAYVEPERVRCIPTCVDPGKYLLARHDRTGGAIRLVWIGQRSTAPSLLCMQSHLAAAARALPGLQLRIIGDAFPTLEGITTVERPWSVATESQELAQADVGISWLPDDAWSRGKCGLKVLQYMAAGLPVVANPVGIHHELVIPGRTGFLVASPEQWACVISRLAECPGLRRALGEAGRRLVEQRYSVGVWADRFATAILDAEGPRPRPASKSERFDTEIPPCARSFGDLAWRDGPWAQRLEEAGL